MKIVIVTGSSRGLGASTAIECARNGMGVVVTYNSSPDRAEDVVKTIVESGGKAVALRLDVGDVNSFSAFREAVAAQLLSVWGRRDFDYLVNNAGYGLFNPIATVTEEQFDGLFNVHLKGPFFLTQRLLPLMAEGGHIINITSATSRVATPGVAPYASFKGGLEVLTRYMAKEFGARGIRANSIAPGAIRTELGGGLNDEFEAMLAGQTVLGRVGEPEEIGGVVANLLSSQNRWINAQNIEVAGAHQYRTRRADGTYSWLEANGRVEKDGDGTPRKFPGVLIDIEDRRAVQAERDRALAALRTLNETLEQRVEERTAALLHAEEALRQAQKMEAVGQLTGGLAHDFNNILAGISGSLDLMKTRLMQGRIGEIDRYMSGAQGAVKRAAALTQRLLAFSRRQTLDPKPSDINRVVSGMHDLISRTVGPEVAVETVGAGGLWTAFVDVGQLENALLNLCINARDAMPGGGRLTIETGNRWLDERAAAQRGLSPGSMCRYA